MFETKYVDERFGHFGHQHPQSLNISVGHQHSKYVAMIEILSPTFKNCLQLLVTNITVAIVVV